jgi:hypothetical protein
MPSASVCPDDGALRRLLLGQADGAEAERLEAHLARCPLCRETVHKITETLRAAGPAAAATTDVPLGMITRPSGLPGEATVEQAAPAGGERCAFLAAPEGPGELGRLGPYRVLKVLGAGGMGLVLQAQDTQLVRLVALKVMKPEVAASAAARQRFQREARATAAVKSDHVITIYNVGEEHGVPFLAMELLEGEPLDQRLARGDRLDTAEVLRLGREMALGLAAAHARGLIHRDLKPGNVWLEAPDGRVKLLDFGLARAAVDDVQVTSSGVVVGTPAYMAPEQARGEKLDHRADLFSLGVVLYRLCTGEMPFKGDTMMAVLTALALANPKPVREVAPDVPPALADLVRRLLAKSPADRPQTAKEVAAALLALEREAAAPPPAPRPAGRGARGRRRVGLGVAAAILVALLGPLAWFFGPTLIRIATNQGELVVEVEDPDVEVVVKPDGVLVRAGTEQTLIITAGDGVVEVRDPAKKDWALLTKEFRLKRGGKEVVRVRRQEVAQAREARPPDAQAAAAPPDKGNPPAPRNPRQDPGAKAPAAPPAEDRPFVVVRRGGGRSEFKTFQAALSERQAGDAIEVHGNGPFPVPALQAGGTGLVLRAAPGYRPVFVARAKEGADRPWLAVLGGGLLVEGCDFRSDVAFPGWLFDSGPGPRPAAAWAFRNCRFLVNGPRGLIHCAAPRLALEDCLVVGIFGEAGLSLDPGADLRLTNNLVSLGGPIVIAAAGNQTLRLTSNTFIDMIPVLRPPLDEAPARPVTVVAEDNVFAAMPLLGDAGQVMPSERVVRTQVKWQGNDNLYLGNYRPYVSLAQEKREVKGLDDWGRLWGREEPGSVEVPWVGLQYNAVANVGPTPGLRAARRETEALCRRLGATARDVGPAWDLVGPGEAYLRAQERASGQRVPRGQLRPPAPPGGPFVLLRKQEEPRGHATLQAALDAARDGDVVEVRTDGPFLGASLKAPDRGGRLTVRAAPGYRPAVETGLRLDLPKADVEVEGLAFQNSGHLTGDYGRLTVRNCSLWGWKEGVSVSCVLHGPGQAARFVNSQFTSTGPVCSVGPGQGVLLENCIASRASINARADDDDCEMVIRHSLCWSNTPHSGSVACDGNPRAQPRVHAEDSVFVGGGVLTGSAGRARWSGTHNLYGLVGGFAVFQPYFTLEAWQKRFDSDRDSLATPSPFLEPRLWRLLPGQARRPDGKDYGADVDRLARTTAPDAGKPFVLVRGEGGGRSGFEALADALAERREGDAIEVHGDGPFPVPAAEVDGRGLVLRAAPGFRPVLLAQPEEGAARPWLAVSGGVLVEGCDIHGDTAFPGWLIDGGPGPRPAAPWAFRNCRFWVNGARGLIRCAAPGLALEDCLVVGNFAEAGLSLAPGADAQMTNNLLGLIGPQGIVAEGNQTLHLTNNTFNGSTFRVLRPPLDEAPARPVTVVAEGNVFWNGVLLVGEGGRMPSEKVTRVQVKWQGKDNFYVRGGPYVSFAQEKREVKTLDDWNRLWGREEPGSVEVPWMGLQYESVVNMEPRRALRMERQEVEALGRRLGAAARTIGPDWDLVGPGDAYVKARALASGTLIPRNQLRPPAPAGGPFVLLRKQEAPRGHATLQAALDATRDGDVVEVRTDGPFPGASLKAPDRGGRLTIRAAPGYRPEVQTRVHLELPKADVEFEGLAFQHSGHLTGDYGRLTVRNCSLWAYKERIPSVSCVLHGPGQAARFLNSVFNTGPVCSVGPGQGILLENCLVMRTSLNARAEEDACDLVIRRCACWGSAHHEGPVACDGNPKAKPRVHAEDSVFVGGSLLAWTGRNARWSGTHNLYSLTAGFAAYQPFYTLEAWQKRWNSDRDSLVTPSPFLEPRLWRFLPRQRKRPDGRDYGADVDRVARTAATGTDKPFVLVRGGGDRLGFATFAEALAERQAGDVLEVHGDGPFPVPALQADDKGLTLRAAPGHRPVFVARVEEGARRPWLAALGGEVLVEGCDFRCDVIFPGWFFDGGPEPPSAAPWTFRGCRFWVNGARGLIRCAAPRLLLEDCLIVGTFDEALLSLGLRVDLKMTNNLVYLGAPQAIVASGLQTVWLTDNHIDAGGAALLRPPLDEAPARPVTVVAEGNIFAHLPLLGDGGAAMPSENVTRTQVKWQGKNNLYLRTGRPYVAFTQGQREVKSLNDWNQLWGRAEPGSVEVPWLGIQYAVVLESAPAAALRTARQEVEALGDHLGAAARGVGPAWDLLGPGEAYVRALERSSGKLLPGAKLRPGAPAGGPFVLLRGGEAPAGHATLQAALDATRDGDTIEVRGDGPFPGATAKAPERGGRLTLRAAPGYRPQLSTSLHLEMPKAEVEIEGLTFEQAHLTGDFARLTMRHCAMHAGQEFWTAVCTLHGPGPAGHFLGCLFNTGPACRVGPGQSLLFENCLLARPTINARGEEDCEMVLRRCLCWPIHLGWGMVACDSSPKARPRVHAEDSVFVGGAALTGSAGQARWSGRHNLYSVLAGFAVNQPFYTLEAWQKRFDSDRDSLATPPPFLEPRMWRLLPGQAKRPDGRDYGADVDRVARAAARR